MSVSLVNVTTPQEGREGGLELHNLNNVVLRTRCAWCLDHDPSESNVSHTICPTCLEKLLAEPRK